MATPGPSWAASAESEIEDLERIRETLDIPGHRVEIIDRQLVVSPSPSRSHSSAVDRLIDSLIDVKRAYGWQGACRTISGSRSRTVRRGRQAMNHRQVVDPNSDRVQAWTVATWGELERGQPGLADAGRRLLYQFGVGLAFLATVRGDGGPRVHPICPLIEGDGLYAFIVPGPKQADLRRDGRYSLHSFPCPDNEDAFYCTGRAHQVDDPATRQVLARLFVTERSDLGVPAPGPDDQLFGFGLQQCLLTRTTGHGDPSPRHTVWHEPGKD
jgi:hypothetical protein